MEPSAGPKRRGELGWRWHGDKDEKNRTKEAKKGKNVVRRFKFDKKRRVPNMVNFTTLQFKVSLF